MDLRDRRDTYNGFGEGLSRAFEIAVTPAIFFMFGYALDRYIGTVPIFSIVLLLAAFIGMFIRLWYAYDAKMNELESSGPWSNRNEPNK